MNKAAATRRILEEVHYATIATADTEGKPWNTPVFSAYDDDFAIYWCSHPLSAHSRNIAVNPDVAIVIYNSRAAEGEGLGVYIQATAEELSIKTQVRRALDLLGRRRGKPFKHTKKFMGSGSQRVYKATPQAFWINDAEQDEDGDFVKDYRVEVRLK